LKHELPDRRVPGDFSPAAQILLLLHTLYTRICCPAMLPGALSGV
jgi:hypothetical protein